MRSEPMRHLQPVTADMLVEHFARAGVRPGATLLLHCSMRSIGWVIGGATTVVGALLDVLGERGTLVVPAQTPDNRDPSRWCHRPVPESWWPVIRDHLPAFDPRVTPSSGMGVVAERVRTWPGARRSDHPQTSFAAVGERAAEVVAGHRLESQLGEDSPLARLEELDADVLLLGVGFDRCTAFHLAEYRQPDVPRRIQQCVVGGPGGRRWVRYETAALDARDFDVLGAAFAVADPTVAAGRVGSAPTWHFSLRSAVAFASTWLVANRARSGAAVGSLR